MADPGGCLEVRLFYVRVSPHGGAAPPARLALELRPAGGDGEAQAPAIPLPLRLDRHDAASGEATYVSTAAARLAPPAAAFDVADHRGAALLRGSLRRCPGAKGGSPAWEIDCVPAAGAAAAASASASGDPPAGAAKSTKAPPPPWCVYLIASSRIPRTYVGVTTDFPRR